MKLLKQKVALLGRGEEPEHRFLCVKQLFGL